MSEVSEEKKKLEPVTEKKNPESGEAVSEADVKTQYCDADNCMRDCHHGAKNMCDALVMNLF